MENTIIKPTLLDDVVFKPSVNCLGDKYWNWVNPNKAVIEKPANYYESSLSEWHLFEPLAADIECDVLVIGGGLLGTSTALHLAEQGVETVLIEKDRIGSAASGRNGGQLTPGLARWEAEDMLERLTHEEAKKLWHFTSVESMDLLDELIEKYALDVVRKRGHITAAVHEGHLTALAEGVEARKHLGEDNARMVTKQALLEHINSGIYFGALIDDLGGHLHPLALNRGLAHAFCQNGGVIYESTEVTEVAPFNEQTEGIQVITSGGVIKARKGVVLSVHSSSFKLLKERNQTTVPFYTYVSTTAPLEVDVKTLLPTEHAVYDTQLQIDYYRAVTNNRLLFGGQGTGSCWGLEKTQRYLLNRINTVFPQLKNVQLDFVWSGVSDLTLNGAVDSRKQGDKCPVYAVHGWSGHGVAQTVRIGKAIAEDVVGKSTDFAMLTKIDHANIPLGRLLAPVAIPLAKGAFSLSILLNPGKMISF